MFLKTGGGKFLKNSAATGGMIQKNDRPPLTAFYSYAGHVLTKAEIDLARRVYRALARLPRGGSLHQVHGLLWRALITESWDIRFIFLWIVLEALFGSESATGEVAFRLSSRLALFLESEGAGARALYDDAKKSYNVRSRIVHGLRLKNLPDDQADRYMGSLERWVRDSLVKVVLDDRLHETFAGNGREAYLEGLMFGDGGEVAILPSTLSEP